ncbi:PREDICTED: rap guanine nucleotide exchange factor 6-like [Rhinopithecus bieti]|uniref:rap guanine nucleotide exchange factor 6-like n=1 Tax=Rhinopithecus bieti TaxID=61621 RepID=UPI0004F1E1B5|nr:PREDICTED: rap guanine nucleotide exchange factor 6-like [Rhinopithecus bieti]
MNSPVDPGARQALRKKPPERTPEDLNTIYSYLHGMEILSNLREHQLRLMSARARYERYSGNQVLFCSETIARCWYILLSGSVLVKGSMVLPPCRYVHICCLVHMAGKVNIKLFCIGCMFSFSR